MSDAASGRVVALHISPARGIEMRSVPSVQVHAGHGIDGDRYRNSRHRHVSVQRLEDLQVGAEALGSPIEPGATRRNITVSGIDVPTTPGAAFKIGSVLFEVVRIAAPCRLLDDWIAPGAKVALRRRAGSIMRVQSDGTITLGDLATIDA